jgi:hypothetical protein
MTRTVIALYENFDTVLNVVEDLVEAGLPSDSISFAANDDSMEKYAPYLEENKIAEMGNVTAGEGAGFGAIVGSLIGLGMAVIPGIGPVIAAGPLVSALVGAAAGAVTGGIVAGLVDLGVPESEADVYAEGIRRGGVLLIVKAEDHWAEAAIDIMERYEPVNIEGKLQDWRQQGWSRFDNGDSPYIRSEGTVDTRSKKDGGKVGSWRTDVPKYTDLDTDFRQHYQQHYTQTGYDYEYYYLPAYRYGYTLATEGRFIDYTWEDLEPEARRRWEVRHDGPWDNFKDAVRYAWEKMRYRDVGQFPEDSGTSA